MRKAVGLDQFVLQNRSRKVVMVDERIDFPIVGIGASAGGLESLERLFTHLPTDTGMAFVVLQHLSPDFKSLMDELLCAADVRCRSGRPSTRCSSNRTRSTCCRR